MPLGWCDTVTCVVISWKISTYLEIDLLMNDGGLEDSDALQWSDHWTQVHCLVVLRLKL